MSAASASAAPRLSVGEDVLRRAEDVRSPASDYAVDFRIDVTDPTSSWKERTALYSMVASGKDRSFVLMREPEEFYPGLLLIAEGYYWMMLPRSDKPFQLSPRHVLAGDVSNGDLARGNLLAHYAAEIAGYGAEVEERPCYELALTRTKNLGLYGSIRAWIDAESFRPLRFEYFGNTGAPLKTARYLDYRGGELGVRAMRIEIENHVRPAERTTLIFTDLRRFDARGFVFTKEGLTALRDAANALQEETGGQATLDEIRERLLATAP